MLALSSARVITLLNLCLSYSGKSEHSGESSDHERVLGVTTLSMKQLCPDDIRGALSHKLTEGSIGNTVPSKILIFPSSQISSFLIDANYPSDGRHYGFPMYVPFMRSLQGVAHEFRTNSGALSSTTPDDIEWEHRRNKCRMFQGLQADSFNSTLIS